ncbi:hypothetical protein RvY_14975, partial [Ramazzottius varieornatus]
SLGIALHCSSTSWSRPRSLWSMEISRPFSKCRCKPPACSPMCGNDMTPSHNIFLICKYSPHITVQLNKKGKEDADIERSEAEVMYVFAVERANKLALLLCNPLTTVLLSSSRTE